MNLIECQKKAKDEDKKFKFRIINLPKAREKSKIRAKKPRTTNENTPLKQFVDKFNRL